MIDDDAVKYNTIEKGKRMDSHTHQTISKILLILSIFVAVLLLVAPAAALPPRPPRPPHVTPTATAQPAVNASTVVDGGFIRLTVSAPRTGLQAVVQWEDGNGNWHNVSGWQNTVSQPSVKWWVSPADFGKGPFRWIVYEDTPSNVIATSETFFLPASEEHIVDVFVSLNK